MPVARFIVWEWSALERVPIAAWVMLLAALAFVGEYVVLRRRQGRYTTQAGEAERRLVRFATALRNYARDNLQRLPAELEELNLPEADKVVYRSASRLNLDEKLILLHDREPMHKVLEFPVLREGRGVVFANGRLVVVSEEVFEKLIAADDALRERVGLGNDGQPPAEANRNGATR